MQFDSPPRRSWLRPLGAALAAALAASAIACGGRDSGGTAAAPTVPPPSARALTDMAEGQYLAGMNDDLAALVRAQPWFQGLTRAHVDLIGAIRKCEKASEARGEVQSVHAMLSFAAQQPWYQDGLDEGEAKALKGAFEAYAESLSDRNAPPIGPVLKTTIASALFTVVDLPESREMVLLASADDPPRGQQAMALAAEYLPQIESLVGAYPYTFLYIMITDLPEVYAGLSYDEFIAISPRYLDRQTIAHELTHSTLYGIFPIWFEEGFAHFMEYYLTGTLEDGATVHTADLQFLRRGTKLDLRPKPGYDDADYMAERAQGFLFIKGIFDTNGIDAVVGPVRSLRTRTVNAQELVWTFAQFGTTDQQQRLAGFVCQGVVGATRDYCAIAARARP